MGFAQHFSRISNSPKNKFAPAGVSGGAIRRLEKNGCADSAKNPSFA